MNLTKKIRAYFSACGKKARGVKKNYSAAELALRKLRLAEARKLRWPKK